MEKRNKIQRILVIVSFCSLLDFRLTISADVHKKSNHTIKEIRKIHDQKSSPSNFNYRMHSDLHSLFDNGHQLKTLYTNMGSGNNQVQLKYITGQGLLSPIIIRASDLGLMSNQEQAQLQGLPEILNDFNNPNRPKQLNQSNQPNKANQLITRPGKHNQPFSRPDLLSNTDAGLMKTKRKKKRKKQPFFKFSKQDSIQLNRPNSMQFNRHNLLEFPSSMNDNSNHNGNRFKKLRTSFKKSYDDLMNSAKNIADTIETSSDSEDVNLESEGREKKTVTIGSFESSKFNFNDEMKLSTKDEDELYNLEKLENLSGFGSGDIIIGGGLKKTLNVGDFKDDFDSIEKSLEKSIFSSSTDSDKFGDLLNNEKFSDLFGEKYEKNDDEEKEYDKLYDKIINNISDVGDSDKYSVFDDNRFDEHNSKKTDKKTIDKSKKENKPELLQKPNDETNDNETTNGHKEPEQEDLKAENEQFEYNTNNNAPTDAGEYDYAGYVKDPAEQSEEQTENNDADKSPDKVPPNGSNNDADNGPDKGHQIDGGKYQDQNTDSHAGDNNGEKYTDGKYEQSTFSPSTDEREPENYNNNYKVPKSQSTVDEEHPNNNERSFQPFTRLSFIKNAKNPFDKFATRVNLNGPNGSNKPNNRAIIGSSRSIIPNHFAENRTKKKVQLRSKRMGSVNSNSEPNLIRT